MLNCGDRVNLIYRTSVTRLFMSLDISWQEGHIRSYKDIMEGLRVVSEGCGKISGTVAFATVALSSVPGAMVGSSSQGNLWGSFGASFPALTLG